MNTNFLNYLKTCCTLLNILLITTGFKANAFQNLPEKPNIILILADDLGYGDLACYGSKDIYTPNLDRLAASGMRFTQFYSASAVCTPTRASILSGRYPYRFGITTIFLDDDVGHLPKGEILLPHLLKTAGYTTAHVGKWHLGGLNAKHTLDRETYPYGPNQMGFDHSVVMFEDPAFRGVMNRGKRIYKDGAKYYMENDKLLPPSDRHLTDFETDNVLQMMEEQVKQEKPFFINFCPFNPHTPLEPAPKEFMDMYAGKATGDDLLYKAMVTHLDASAGRIINKVKELGIEENTLIIFLSDNGPANSGSVGALRGRKFDLYEGGIKTPAVMRWKGQIKPGTVSNTFGHTTDLLRTICEVAGAPVPPEPKLDGVSLVPLLKQGENIKRGTTFWQMRVSKVDFADHTKTEPFANMVARNEDWKLMALDGEAVGLYNLAKDPNEKTNLLDKEKKIAHNLLTELRAWKKECENGKTFAKFNF